MTYLSWRLASLAILSAAIASTASAQLAKPKPLPDLSGVWMFQTATLPKKNCVIAGEIEFTRKAGDSYHCAFVSTETCPNGFQTVKQTCLAKIAGADVEILSKVDHIVDAGPAEARDVLMDVRTYNADNFRVHAVTGETLVGLFFSRNKAGVRFWRKEGLVS